MRRDMINVRRRDEAAFLRALPAIRLLRQPRPSSVEDLR
jgi:hypothetical protein